MTTEIKKVPSKLDTIDSFPTLFSTEWKPPLSRLHLTLDDIFALVVKKGTLTHPKNFQSFFSSADPTVFNPDWFLISLLVLLGASVFMVLYLFPKNPTSSITPSTRDASVFTDDESEQLTPRVPMDTTPLPFNYENPDSLKHIGADPNLSFEEQRLIDLKEELLRSKALAENSENVKQFIVSANIANIARESLSLANRSKPSAPRPSSSKSEK